VVLYIVAVGMANWVSVAQFDTKRVSMPSTSLGGIEVSILSTQYRPPLVTSLCKACVHN